MPRLLAVGHVSWDRRPEGEVLGGSVSYAALSARKLGWDAAVLTATGPELDPERDLPGIEVFAQRGRRSTRFTNQYEPDGTRTQLLTSRAEDVELIELPDVWRRPEALLLGPVIGELADFHVAAFEADCVGAIAQGWVREVDPQGRISPRDWDRPQTDLAGVHVLFLSEHDLPGGAARVPELLTYVPMIALTRGWRGLVLHTRQGATEVPSYPRPEVDPTGAGDVFAAAFLVRYHETDDPIEAAAFAACAASCAVEGVGATTLGDRYEVVRRLEQRDRLLEEGEWDE
jgi:sugar/nucleoside kinase (ribokinase family)